MAAPGPLSCLLAPLEQTFSSLVVPCLLTEVKSTGRNHHVMWPVPAQVLLARLQLPPQVFTCVTEKDLECWGALPCSSIRGSLPSSGLLCFPPHRAWELRGGSRSSLLRLFHQLSLCFLHKGPFIDKEKNPLNFTSENRKLILN